MFALFADTSALIKWYVAEANSDEVDALFLKQPGIAISRLAGVEFCSALKRRRRNKQISRRIENEALDLFYAHHKSGNLLVLPLNDQHCAEAERLMRALPRIALRALDAMQLATATLINATEFASADRIQIAAAKALGLTVHDFS